MDFLLLGPVAVTEGDRPLPLGGSKQRALLAMLLVHANEVVPGDELIEALWAGEERAHATKALQVAVSRLRRALGHSEVVVTRAPGYVLCVEPEHVDVTRFEALADAGREALAAGDAPSAHDLLADALSLWRGPPLADLTYESVFQVEISRLQELRAAAFEDRLAADLETGHHAELVAELRTLVSNSPLRERLRGQLMLALYRSGRQAEALAAYQEARDALTDGLGIEPSRELRELQQAVLTQDALLDLPQRPSAAGPDPPRAPLRLPLPHTRTVGRSADLARLRELLREERLLTLVGAGGIGKTRLAVELARAVYGDYADGARFVSLATTQSPDAVADTLGVALGVAPRHGEAALTGVARLIGDKQMLVVLDNFEHVLPAAQVVGELLDACEGLRLVATSREPLRLSCEQLFVVRPLALPAPADRLDLEAAQRSPAISLFVDRCRARDPGFTLTEADAVPVAEICARVDGMPLAIELAAGHVPLLAPAELTRRLDDALSMLVGGPRDAPPRHQTLRATLDWSHALLDPEEQATFAGLAVFSGGCTVEAAEAVVGVELDAVEALLAKSLLVTAAHDGGQPRVRMLEPVRAYAVERLEGRPDKQDLHRRHCEYHVSLAERAGQALRGPDQLTWMSRLDADRANLRAAVTWSLEAQRPELGLRLASALVRAGRLQTETRGWIEATLTAAADLEPHLRARGHLALGLIMGGGPAAMEQVREGLRLFRAQSDVHGAAEALIALSMDTDQAGDADGACALAREALELARATGDDWLIACALGAQMPGSGQRFQETRDDAEHGLDMLRRCGDRIQLSVAVGNRGFAAMSAGDYAAAAPDLDEAVAISEELQEGRFLPFTLVNRGLLHALQGADVAARRDFVRALALCRAAGEALPVAEALVGLAAIAVRRGDTELGARLAGAADAQRVFDAVGVAERRLLEQVIDPARPADDDAAWARAWKAGNALTFDQAVAFGIDALAASDHTTTGAPPKRGP
jgi:predicted ATPase/DNA-binding SARP family transcriptional activator